MALPKLVTVRQVNAVLRKLAKTAGYFTIARAQDVPCCTSCGWYEVPEHKRDVALFYNLQAIDDRTVLNGKMYRSVHLAWGNGVDFEVVRKAFAEKGIKVIGGDDRDKKIEILPELMRGF